MLIPGNTVKIQTLGHFNISVDGNSVAREWPDETVKVLFCSLLSPLDLYFTWDRICRSMWETTATPTNRRHLGESIIRPLNSFLIKELGFNPLVVRPEGISIDRMGIYVDAHEFYSTVLEGLQLLSNADSTAAREKFYRADTLYTGSYLPGIPGKIVVNTRNDLESLYRTAVMDATTQSRNSTRPKNSRSK